MEVTWISYEWVSLAVWYEMTQATALAAPLCVYLNSARYEHFILSALIRYAAGAEAKLESETSPVWCGHKDVLHLNKRNPFQEKRDRERGSQP